VSAISRLVAAATTHPIPILSEKLNKIMHLPHKRLLKPSQHEPLAKQVLRHTQAPEAPRLLAALAQVLH
jgi:hypothetical protein